MKRFLPQKVFVFALLLAFNYHMLYGQGVMGQGAFMGVSSTLGGSPWAPAQQQSGINIPRSANEARASQKTDGTRNYKSFTPLKKNLSEEAKTANAGYERHPDFGILYAGTPCGDCYELISERTEMTKTFVREGIHEGGKEKMTQTSTHPMHYRDADGNWRTINTHLQPDMGHKGVYAVPEEITPIFLNTNAGNSYSSLGKEGEGIKFNHNLELVYVQPDGREVSLGVANYIHYTAGDEGMYVTNAWPGIDMEVIIMRAAVKTNFHISHAMPQYAEGKLLIRDHLSLSTGLGLSVTSGSVVDGDINITDQNGNLKYAIGGANVYEKDNRKSTVKSLNYEVGNEHTLDIALPGSYLNMPEVSYPIVIDPLVSVATSTTINGSTYITALTTTSGCPYLNAANTPTNCTITDIQFAFQYTAPFPNWIEYAGSFFYKGACRSPGTLAGGNVWTCGPPGGAAPGTCTATSGPTYSIWGTPGPTTSGLGPCVPAPQCASYPLNITMYFYQSYAAAAACATTYAYGSQPLVITVIGHTVEFVSATATPATICLGQSTTLTGSGQYGVPPYTFTWTPGPIVGSPATVTPGGTTTYLLTITDACGITATGNTTVTVNTVAPITGTLSLCVGNTTTLADATGGAHTWTSSNPGVATITSPGGVVNAIAAGTTTITYTSTATGCYATAVLTVTPLPAPITGITSVCAGSTTNLTDATAGVPWSSSNAAVATISGTGVVTGVSAGTATITCGGPTCYVTTTVTVNPVLPITGTLSICLGGTSALTDAVPGGTWLSTNTGVATVSGTGLVTSVSGGTTTISYTSPAGCVSTVVVTVNPIAPISGTLTICQGSTTTLTDAAGAGTWSSSNIAVATAGLATGIISGISPGTSTITFVTAGGCTTSAVVTVNPTTPITGLTTICAGTTTTLSDVSAGGAWSSTNTTVATITSATGIVSALAAGTTTISYLLPSGCYATTIFTVINVAPITGNPELCAGSTTTLNDITAGGTWNSGNPGVATIGLATGVVSGISAGTSVITYTSGGGCTTTIVVTVDPLPAAITGNTNVCVGLTTTLSDVTPGGVWSSSNTAIAGISGAGVVTGVTAGGVNITYQLPTGCLTTIAVIVNPLPAPISGAGNVCAGSSITLGDALTGGTWISNNSGVATIGISSGVVNGITAGTAIITYTLPTSCLITAPVTVVPVPAAPITAPLDYCQGATAVPLTATGNNLLWYTGGAGSTTAPIPSTGIPGVFIYSVTQTVNGCESAMATLQVTVHIHAIFNIVPARPNACQDDTITFSYGGPYFAGITYEWGLPSNGVLSSGSSLTNSSILMYFDTSLGYNYITLTVGDGYIPCNVTDSLPMTVYNNHPVATFYLKPDICVGDTVSIALSYIGPGVTDYTWDFNGATIISSSSNHGGPFVVSWSTAGVYTVALTAISNLSCPSVPILDTVDVHPYPDARIAPPVFLNSKTSSLCLGDSVLLDVLNYTQGDLYEWSPEHFFEQWNVNRVWGTIQMPGYVYLTVMDPFGCASKDSVLFDAQPCCQVLFPNAFTPNGDHKNDVFRPVTIGNHTVHEFRIVNRWGQTVFESANEKGAWDGNFNGVPQDLDVYFYYFKYECDGKIMEQKGEVNLIR